MNTKICNLCGISHSERVGSHIFTESLIRANFNADCSTKRSDKELIFSLSSKKIGLEHVGRGVLPEQLENNPFVNSENIIITDNPYINFDLVCRACEKRFNHIETYFISKIYNELIDKNSSYSFKSIDEKIITDLFFLINIWRAAVSDFENLNISPSAKDSLGEYINIVLSKSNDIQESIANYKSKSQTIIKFLPYFLEMKKDEDPSTNAIFADTTLNPVILLLSRFLIICSEDLSSLKDFPTNIPISKNRFVEDVNSDLKIISSFSNDERRATFLSYSLRAWQESVDKAHETLNKMMFEKFNYSTTVQDHENLQLCIQETIQNGDKISHEILINCAAFVSQNILRENQNN